MSYQVDRRTVVRWLRDHDFRELPRRSAPYTKYTLDGQTGNVSVPDTGPVDLRKCHVSLIIRALADMGFDPDTTRAELKTGRWVKPNRDQRES